MVLPALGTPGLSGMVPSRAAAGTTGAATAGEGAGAGAEMEGVGRPPLITSSPFIILAMLMSLAAGAGAEAGDLPVFQLAPPNPYFLGTETLAPDFGIPDLSGMAPPRGLAGTTGAGAGASCAGSTTSATGSVTASTTTTS